MDVTTNEWFITSATLAIPTYTSYADVSAEFLPLPSTPTNHRLNGSLDPCEMWRNGEKIKAKEQGSIGVPRHVLARVH